MKKVLIALAVVIMAMCLAGCGSSEGDGDAAKQEGGTSSGIQNVVFTVPEGWTRSSVYEGEYIDFVNPEENLYLGVSCVNDENLESFVDVEKTKTVEEYYKKRTTPVKEGTERETNTDIEDSTVCGNEAKVVKVKKDDGYVEVATYCMMDGSMYDFYLLRKDAFDAEGNIKKDAAVLTDEEMAVYQSMLDSVKTEDGSKLQMEGVSADSLGDVSFEIPTGFRVTAIDEYYVGAKNENDTEISIMKTEEDDLDEYEGASFKTLKEVYDFLKSEGAKDTKIAGCEGFVVEPSEEDPYGTAVFMTDEVVYQINLYNPSETFNPTDDEVASFDSFVKSIKTK